MIRRSAGALVAEQLAIFPAVGLLGPRQVGKSTLAREIAGVSGREVVYLDLESPRDRAKLTGDAEAYLSAQTGKLVVLDEVQRVPEIFQVLRVQIDARRRRGERSGSFLVLGSASLALLKQSSESLAGRIGFVDLTPILPQELPLSIKMDDLWSRGGYPDALLAKSDKASLLWREAFIRTYLERDIPQLGINVAAETLRRFWTMLAHLQGAVLNASRLAESLGASHTTIRRHLDLLSDLLLVRQLSAYANNTGKRLVKSPKVFIRDSGIVHALLGIADLEGLLSHPTVGASWEGMVIEALIAAAGQGARASYYRTSAGAEIDLVLEVGRHRVAIEIKRSSAPVVSKGYYVGADTIAATERWVVYSGEDSFPGAHGATMMSVKAAAKRLLEMA